MDQETGHLRMVPVVLQVSPGYRLSKSGGCGGLLHALLETTGTDIRGAGSSIQAESLLND